MSDLPRSGYRLVIALERANYWVFRVDDGSWSSHRSHENSGSSHNSLGKMRGGVCHGLGTSCYM
jgi:hypothetical protein